MENNLIYLTTGQRLEFLEERPNGMSVYRDLDAPVETRITCVTIRKPQDMGVRIHG